MASLAWHPRMRIRLRRPLRDFEQSTGALPGRCTWGFGLHGRRRSTARAPAQIAILARIDKEQLAKGVARELAVVRTPFAQHARAMSRQLCDERSASRYSGSAMRSSFGRIVLDLQRTPLPEIKVAPVVIDQARSRECINPDPGGDDSRRIICDGSVSSPFNQRSIEGTSRLRTGTARSLSKWSVGTPRSSDQTHETAYNPKPGTMGPRRKIDRRVFVET